MLDIGYLSAWSEMMTTIFRDRLLRNVYSSDRNSTRWTGTLFRSVSSPDVEGNFKAVRYRFVEYGLFVDRGVGKEVSRGNIGDIGKYRQSGNERVYRVAKPWFSSPWRRSLVKLAEELAERNAISSIHHIVETLEK